MQLLFEQQGIRAERDEFLAGDHACDDLPDLLVDQRFAARNSHHRRAALVHRIQALLDRHAPVQDGVGIVDLSAADAGQIAAEQRLQHQHERVALAAHQLLPEQIGAETYFLQKWDPHASPSNQLTLQCAGASAAVNSAGRRNSILSARPGSVDTSSGPNRRRVSMTSSTSTSGAEAPAVMPTTSAFSSHCGSNSLPSAMR